MDESESLNQRIKKLEQDLQEKSSLVLIYKEEISRMNEKLSAMIHQLDHDLNIASTIQNLLVPTELPHIKGFEFSNKFKASLKKGGDYFEIIQQEDKYKFSVLVASSSGYAMSALFMSILLKLTTKIASKKSYSPEEFCHTIENEMRKKMKEEDELHLAYAQFDLKKSEIHIAGSGNISCLRWNSKAESVEILDLPKHPIRSKRQSKFVQNTFRYYVGDRLAFASNGFTAQPNKKGHPYGIDSLSQNLSKNISLPIHELRNNIFVSLEAYTQGIEQEKDWSLILVDVKSNLVKLSLK